MKRFFHEAGPLWAATTVIGMVIGLLLLNDPALAADEVAGWRPTYDLIFRWINFLILAGVIVKYGRKPITNFLKGKEKEIEQQIRTLEEEKQNALNQIAEAERMLTDSTDRLAEIRERIVTEGERRKKEIVESAKNESRLMIDDTHRKIDGMLLSAKGHIRNELVDTALAMALERLPQLVTKEDNQKRLREYIDFIQPA